ncbi:MAG: 30S ribosomal protein S18 [Patescibacteria group bacterium]
MQKQNNNATTIAQEKEHCFCCVNNVNEIDYKDLQMMQKFTSMHHKILSRRKSALCMKHQRKVANAIKRSRIMALIPFTNNHK